MLEHDSVIVVQHVRRNYSLTAKDLEADRRQDLERALLLKTASSGKSSCRLGVIYSAGRIVFFHLELNRVVIVGLKSHQYLYRPKQLA